LEAKGVRRVGVVGCGVMGSGISEIAARAGCEVVVVEASDELLASGLARIDSSLRSAVERGRLDPGERDAIRSRIGGSTDLSALADADLVFEAATEDEAAKREIFARLDEVVRPEVVLASNTSSVPIGHLAAATRRGDRVVGMHFFNPPTRMELVELIPGETTSAETLTLARGVAERLGKTAVTSRDRAGFIVNRLLVPYLMDAVRLLEEETATREDIDAAVRLGLGHPMGPLALADLIGLDVLLAIGEILARELGERKVEAPQLLRRMVSEGRLGRKSGSGFYEYPARGAPA
jgi:3-hydroxybutyryl-CoA dehydrogenase